MEVALRRGQVDALAVDEHLRLTELRVRGPAGHGVKHHVELVVGALLDTHLPALAADRDDVGAGKRNQISRELRRR